MHIKGPRAGQPAPLRPYQAYWLKQIFGRVDAQRRREITTAFILMQKKQGKTFIGGMLVLLLISIFGEFGAEVFSLATSKDQAAGVYDAAASLVDLSPRLKGMGFVPRDSTYEIRFPATRSVYRAVPAKAEHLHGEMPLALIVDELHAAKSREAIDAVREGMGIWDEPLTVYITNKAAADGSVPFWEEYGYAKQVLSGAIDDPSYYAYISEAPEGMTPEQLLEEGPHWQEINPAIGDLVPLSHIRRAAREAKQKPSMRGEVLRLHFGYAASSFDKAIPASRWDACQEDFTEADLYGRECAIAVDLSSLWDLTSVTASFPQSDAGRAILSWSFVPEGQVEKIQKKTGQPIRAWVEKGLLKTTPGPVIDFATIERFILDELRDRFWVLAGIYDKKFGDYFAQRVAAAGLDMIQFPYNGYTEAWNHTEARMIAAEEARDEGEEPVGHLRHNGDPVLRWAALSLGLKRFPDESVKPIKPDRMKDQWRIDPFVALLMTEWHLGTAEVDPPLTADSFRMY